MYNQERKGFVWSWEVQFKLMVYSFITSNNIVLNVRSWLDSDKPGIFTIAFHQELTNRFLKIKLLIVPYVLQ